jgi:cholesterol oxidase
MSFDAIVVGSGFGGAVTALRFAEAGMRVLVLERGRRWSADTLPRKPGDPWMWSHSHPERENGWLDLRLFRNMAVAQGAAVGGGSHIYANISVEAPPTSFINGWPDEITHAELTPFYAEVARMMEVRPVPDNQWTKRMELMRDAAVAAGYGDRFRKVDLAVQFDEDWTYATGRKEEFSKPIENIHGAPQGTCVHLGTCDIGCKVNARNTLDLNYLYVAENRHGVDVRSLHLVDRIEPVVNGGWRVHFDRLEQGQRIRGTEDARILVIAAGSLNSTELLLRNRDVHHTLPHLSPKLGQNWSSNGDFLTPAIYLNREVDASWGPTIASIIDFHDGSIDGQHFWIQDGGVPDLLAAYVAEKADEPDNHLRQKLLFQGLKSFLGRADPLRWMMPWFAQGVDGGNGHLSLTQPGWFSPGGELHLDWDVTKSAPVIEAIIGLHKLFSEKTGGKALVPPTWTLLRELVTPHPLGGCNMGADVANGVVDHKGAVFGYTNLYVLDGAIVPRALGVNPSRTIAALAERNARLIAGLRPPSPPQAGAAAGGGP